MTIDTRLDALQSTAANANKPQKELGQSDFLRLLTVQLANQDPLSPLDNSQFIAQMAQFSSVESLGNLQTSFERLSDTLTSNQALQASSLVGRQVLVPSDVGFLPEEGSLKGAIDVPVPADDVKVTVRNESGDVVREIDLGSLEAGVGEFEWDGKDAAGNRLESGQYSVKIEGKVGGNIQTLSPGVYGQVESVNLGQGFGELILNVAGLGGVPLSQVREIAS